MCQAQNPRFVPGTKPLKCTWHPSGYVTKVFKYSIP
jgi:hypothetical protein